MNHYADNEAPEEGYRAKTIARYYRSVKRSPHGPTCDGRCHGAGSAGGGADTKSWNSGLTHNGSKAASFKTLFCLMPSSKARRKATRARSYNPAAM